MNGTTFFREKEAFYDIEQPDNQWLILRLDGRNFSALTKEHFKKPFDPRFHEWMVATAKALQEELNAPYVYTGSDEISIILKPGYTQWSGRIEKIVSLTASIATAEFIEKSGLKVHFDSRFLLLDKLVDEVVMYIAWRQEDILNNALQTSCYWTLRNDGKSASAATKALSALSPQEKIALLASYGIDFEQSPLWQRYGVALCWERYEKMGFNPIEHKEVVALRRRSIVRDMQDYWWIERYLKEIV